MVKLDKAITIEVLKLVLVYCKQIWKEGKGGPLSSRAALVGAWYACSFCMALRGEEVPLVELAGTRKSMAALKSTHLPPHFWQSISGRTKLNRDSGATFKIPCVAVTEGTGVEAGKWLARHLRCVIRSGRTQGYLFSMREGSRSYCQTSRTTTSGP